MVLVKWVLDLTLETLSGEELREVQVFLALMLSVDDDISLRYFRIVPSGCSSALGLNCFEETSSCETLFGELFTV